MNRNNQLKDSWLGNFMQKVTVFFAIKVCIILHKSDAGLYHIQEIMHECNEETTPECGIVNTTYANTS